MSTTQQVGYALGVAVTGLIFFPAATGDVGRAFELSALQLAALAAGIVVMARLLPRPPDGQAGAAAREATAAVRVTSPPLYSDREAPVSGPSWTGYAALDQ
jgi:hypothetical protein